MDPTVIIAMAALVLTAIISTATAAYALGNLPRRSEFNDFRKEMKDDQQQSRAEQQQFREEFRSDLQQQREEFRDGL